MACPVRGNRSNGAEGLLCGPFSWIAQMWFPECRVRPPECRAWFPDCRVRDPRLS